MTTGQTRGRGAASWVLRAASAVSAMLVSIGLVVTVIGLGGADWVLTSGLVFLVGLPVLRLAVVVGTLARAREWRFVWAGVAVLALLALTLLWRSD